VDVATDVRARRRPFVEHPVFGSERRDFGQALSDDGTLSRLQLVDGIVWSKICYGSAASWFPMKGAGVGRDFRARLCRPNEVVVTIGGRKYLALARRR
jgi:hypothetical protein